MNDLMSLSLSTTTDEADMYHNRISTNIRQVADTELSLLLGNENYTSAFSQSPEEVPHTRT